MMCLPGKSFIPWCEVPIEEVTEDFESFQEGFKVGWRLLVLYAQVDCLFKSLNRSEDDFFGQMLFFSHFNPPVQSFPR